jgi:hypothetical protein
MISLVFTSQAFLSALLFKAAIVEVAIVWVDATRMSAMPTRVCSTAWAWAQSSGLTRRVSTLTRLGMTCLLILKLVLLLSISTSVYFAFDALYGSSYTPSYVPISHLFKQLA